jgi:hypothetical protein
VAITGQCLCGDITYQLDNAPAISGVCHCKNCQRQAGSAFSTLAGVPKSEFTFTSGEPTLYADGDTESGNTVERYFCGRCGSPIYSVIPAQPDMLYQPQFHVWCDSKQSWVTLDEGVPAMAQQS